MLILGFVFHESFLLFPIAWHQSAEQQLLEIETSSRNTQHGKDQNKNTQDMLKCMRDAAFNVYDQFLSEKVNIKK